MKIQTAKHLYGPFLSAMMILPICSASELRELTTDRPDTTESPYTVDAGHFQFEMEIANATRGGSERGFSLAELNAKVGLDDWTDLQVVLPFYTRIRDGGEGIGDVEIRLKHNLWGNDEGSTARAIMPFIKLPSANGNLGNGDFDGGIRVGLTDASTGFTPFIGISTKF